MRASSKIFIFSQQAFGTPPMIVFLVNGVTGSICPAIVSINKKPPHHFLNWRCTSSFLDSYQFQSIYFELSFSNLIFSVYWSKSIFSDTWNSTCFARSEKKHTHPSQCRPRTAFVKNKAFSLEICILWFTTPAQLNNATIVAESSGSSKLNRVSTKTINSAKVVIAMANFVSVVSTFSKTLHKQVDVNVVTTGDIKIITTFQFQTDVKSGAQIRA